MSDTPKFEVIDRRRMKAAEEAAEAAEQQPVEKPSAPAEPEKKNEPAPGPRLVVNEGGRHAQAESGKPEEKAAAPQMPPAPSAEATREQKAAYDASAQRIEDLLRAQNPGMGAQPALSFEHLVQQFYLSGMLQMGAGTQEGQRARIDIIGARNTIDLLGILAEKTRGNLSDKEGQMLETVLFDLRMAFLEISRMVSLQAMQTPPVPEEPEKQ